jgi:HSP20 family molecular chaperone IbpA
MTQTTTIEKRPADVTRPERVRAGRTYVPVVDIIEKPDELLLVADVPGARAEDIDIQYENGQLALTAVVRPRQDENTNYLLCEYGVGDFSRSFQIGEGIDAGRIAAEVSEGVLTLHLPKSEAATPRKINVKAT